MDLIETKYIYSQQLKKYYSDKTIIVTGGLGFIGSNLTNHLVQLGCSVIVIDALFPTHGGNIYNIKDVKNKVEVHNMDIGKDNNLKPILENADCIFNLAGQTSHIDGLNDPFLDHHVNTYSHINFLEECRKYNSNVKIVYTGTRQVYGVPKYLPVDEKHPVQPVDINGINKLSGELYHILYHKIHDMNIVSLRLTNTYGPKMMMKKNKGGFISIFVRKIIDKENITIYGDGEQLRDFNYVDDVCEALILSGYKNNIYGHIFNLGGEPVSLLDFTKLLINTRGFGTYSFKPFPKYNKRIDIGDYYADIKKSEKYLGWKPRTTLALGLKRTVKFYLDNKHYYW